jgi:hypothetical protein
MTLSKCRWALFVVAGIGLALSTSIGLTADAKPQAAEGRADKEGWITLFDGKTLDGWHKNPKKIGHGTGGDWKVEEGGVLSGGQDPAGSGNGGILLTDREFGDFELQIELKPAWGMDSGVFLRSTDEGQALQMLVDYYDGGNVGQFYGEQIGGWGSRAFSLKGELEGGKLKRLTTIDPKPEKAEGLEASCTPEEWLKAWKIGDWNKADITVKGGKYPRITTKINGLQVGVFDAATSDAKDYDKEAVAKTLGEKGHIAVQVHGGKGRCPVGARCRWRNIRVREL